MRRRQIVKLSETDPGQHERYFAQVPPLSGRVVLTAPCHGRGRLLIIDCGGGYHVMEAGVSQLDVRERASVVAG